jgi:hypothetical protein
MITFETFLALEDPFDRLVAEFESDTLAQRFLDAEEADFHWRTRVDERLLGRYQSIDDEQQTLDRVVVIGRLQARWYVAMCLVDSANAVDDLLWVRRFDAETEAQNIFETAR